MDPVSSTYSDTSSVSASAFYRNRQRTEIGADSAAAQDASTPKTPSASASPSSTGLQKGIQATEAREQEFIPYGPDGRREDKKQSIVMPASGKETQVTIPGERGKVDPQVQQEIARLQATEAKVKAHEAAHKAAGGTMTGPVSYTYTRGPDGKNYVTGGEVPISVSSGKTPQETVNRMQQVIQAALAPADPSPQDRAVAAQAATLAQQARQEESSSTAATTASPVSGGAVPSGLEGNARDASGAIQTDSGSAQSGDGATLVQQPPSNEQSPATKDAINGVIARISRSAYGDPAVAGLPESSPGQATLIKSADQNKSAASPDNQNDKRSPISGITPAMITGFGSSRQVSFNA